MTAEGDLCVYGKYEIEIEGMLFLKWVGVPPIGRECTQRIVSMAQNVEMRKW